MDLRCGSQFTAVKDSRPENAIAAMPDNCGEVIVVKARPVLAMVWKGRTLDFQGEPYG